MQVSQLNKFRRASYKRRFNSKIQNKKQDEVERPFTPTCGHPRGGHRCHFIRELVKSCYQRHNFFNNRIVSTWNDLPNEVTVATSVNRFKNTLDEYLNSKRPKKHNKRISKIPLVCFVSDVVTDNLRNFMC